MDPFTLPGLTSDALLLLFTVAGAGVSGVKPLLETIVPFARPGRPLHDWTLHALNFAFNLGLVCAWAAITGHLGWPYTLAIVVQASAQWLGSTGAYHLLTRLGGSIGDSGPSRSSAAAPAASPAAPAVDPAVLAAALKPLADAVASATATLKASGS